MASMLADAATGGQLLNYARSPTRLVQEQKKDSNFFLCFGLVLLQSAVIAIPSSDFCRAEVSEPEPNPGSRAWRVTPELS